MKFVANLTTASILYEVILSLETKAAEPSMIIAVYAVRITMLMT